MEELQKTQENALKAASIPLRSVETGLADTHHKGENNQIKDTPSGQLQRQSRTRFTSIQRYELERAFNQCHYVTPNSFHMLQKLGIPKRTTMVWFKNRRVKFRKKMLSKACSSREHLQPVASSREVMSSHQGSILQAESYRVQNKGIEGCSLVSSREDWPDTSTGRIINGSQEWDGMTQFEATNYEPSLTYKYLSQPPSPAFIHTTALTDGSRGVSQTELLTHSNVSWIYTVPDQRARLPYSHRDSQRAWRNPNSLTSSSENCSYSSTRAATINDSMGCTGMSLPKSTNCAFSCTYKHLSYSQSPVSIQTTPLSYGSAQLSKVPPLDSAPRLKATFPLTHQSYRREPEGHGDPGQQLWNFKDRIHSIALGTEPHDAETSHSSALMYPPKQDLQYTSLLDDLMDVLQSDLATQSN